MKIILSGGGTLGPVIPLLAIREAMYKQHPDVQYVWVGTKNGPEREILERQKLPFFVIKSGKWRRYLSFWNIIDVFKIIFAFFQSLYLLWRQKPDLIISAGGFVSVPLHWAGAVLGIPAWVHQQDVMVGFANRLMFPFAKKITTALEATLPNVPDKHKEWLGNPCRDLSIYQAELDAQREAWGIPAGSTVIFALGGGTGSTSVNTIMLEAVSHWPSEWHIVHLVGSERSRNLQEQATSVFPNYHVFRFFGPEMGAAYALATVVVARAGFGTLTELAAFSKPAVIVPMRGTHQEENAEYLAEHEAIVFFNEKVEGGLKLAQVVKELVEHPAEAKLMASHMHDALPRAKPERIVKIVEELVGHGLE